MQQHLLEKQHAPAKSLTQKNFTLGSLVMVAQLRKKQSLVAHAVHAALVINIKNIN